MPFTTIHEPEESPTCRITDDQLQVVYNLVEFRELDILEVEDYCKDEKILADYQRSSGSLWFTLIRMHILVHGCLPINLDNNPGWFTVPSTMHQFCSKYGLDTEHNMQNAIDDANNRPKKRKREQAMLIMVNFYRENCNQLPDNIKHYREGIIKNLMAGMDVKQAFEQSSRGL